MYNLETPAGQIFYGTHTTFCVNSIINTSTRLMEAEMKMEQEINSFIVDLDVDTENASVAGQALGMCLNSSASEYRHRPWNRYTQFLLFHKENQFQVCCSPTKTENICVCLGQQQS
ncbi:hypothetical protein DPMN_110396 [Dreissena polymorpha]|uniref:Uncharacterized protein n=1 Tax=Dreissena polymorpha TaxID=45954 RepID=A0A9D4KCH6_DREPO|nr:hypothetical protein DPMN_110396 [Dreissena polymorpha]